MSATGRNTASNGAEEAVVVVYSLVDLTKAFVLLMTLWTFDHPALCVCPVLVLLRCLAPAKPDFSLTKALSRLISTGESVSAC